MIREAFTKGKRYIGYLTAGDGGVTRSKEMALAMIDGGVDLLEIGLPFSEPVADGPVIRGAVERALKAGTSPGDVLVVADEIRKVSTVPILIMTYYNPILSGGLAFLREAKRVGVNGLLIVDLPPEEAGEYLSLMKEVRLETVFLVAPSTPPERVPLICRVSSGFVYYACRKGTTGMRKGYSDDLSEKVAMIRSHTDLPVAVGFGVASADTAEKILRSADGFIVGSLFVDTAHRAKDPVELTRVVASLDPREKGYR
ncbi:MAG: tryptophan synthase subunit alpha [Simkaniaceae bacterium]|nr:tryptophan synthase subunit alpha [Simkaniaceae bacterium]